MVKIKVCKNKAEELGIGPLLRYALDKHYPPDDGAVPSLTFTVQSPQISMK